MNKIFTFFVALAIASLSMAQSPDTLNICRNGFNVVVLESFPPQYRFIPEKPDSLGVFFWDFGDGTFSYELSPVHTYQVSGSYLVSFYYTSPDTCTSYVADTLNATGAGKCNAEWVGWPAAKDPSGPFDSVATGSYNTYIFQDMSKGDIISWRWRFGDGGESTEQNPVHEFTTPGMYTVCLEIVTSDSCSGTFCSDIYVEDPGLCNLTGTVRNYTGLDGCGLLIELDNGIVIEPAEIVPNFILYEGERVRLSYTELKDRASICMAGIIARIDCITEIREDSCKAAFTWYPLPWVSSVPPIYQFDIVDPHRNIVKSSWDFGDGTLSEGFTATHRFPRDGYYTVCLTVETLGGCVVTNCETSWFDGYDPEPGLCNSYIKLVTDVILNGHNCNGSATAALVDEYGNNVPAEEYYWSTGESGAVIYNLCPGSMYSVIVTDTGGCAVSGSFSFGGPVTYPDSLIGYWNYEQNYRDFRFNLPVYSDSVYCVWDFGDGKIAEGSVVNHTYDDDLNYTVSVNVMDLRGNILYNQVIQISSGAPLGIKQTDPGMLRVYPVPVTDRLYLELKGDHAIDRIEISNAGGQVMMVKKDINRNNDAAALEVSDLPAGFYIGRIVYQNKANREFKFVKD